MRLRCRTSMLNRSGRGEIRDRVREGGLKEMGPENPRVFEAVVWFHVTS